MANIATMIAASSIDLDSWDAANASIRRGRQADTRHPAFLADVLDTIAEENENEEREEPFRFALDLLATDYDGSPLGENAGTLYAKYNGLIKEATETDPSLKGMLRVVKRKGTNAVNWTLDTNEEYCVLAYN